METTAEKNMIRYHVLPDRTRESMFIFEAQTGRVEYPECWLDMAAYCNYLIGRGRIDEAQNLLDEIMAGHKPITQMKPGAVISAAALSR
jgi:hypothetical protein